MSDYAVKFEEISKVYQSYSKPTDRLKELITGKKDISTREVLALQDLSFEIPRGTTFGIVGKNGSGKSTTLQIMASVLQPTSGTVTVQGKITALLELGSGFNTEFSGIDNVFLYGSILGLSDQEIRTRLDSIIDFSEIGDFVYQPVKTYSTGMLLRLAFSVATAVDPDIVIIDEALAVGDALFQHKCLGRLKEMMSNGATVVFVSHDFAAVKALCRQAILLDSGRLLAQGSADQVVRAYHKHLFEKETVGSTIQTSHEVSSNTERPKHEVVSESWPKVKLLELFKTQADKARFGTGQAHVQYVDVVDENAQSVEIVPHGAMISVRVFVTFYSEVESAVVGLIFKSSKGIDVLGLTNVLEDQELENVEVGESVIVEYEFKNQLQADTYSLSVAVIDKENVDKMKHFDWVDNVRVVKVPQEQEKRFFGVYYPESMKISFSRGLHEPQANRKASA